MGSPSESPTSLAYQQLREQTFPSIQRLRESAPFYDPIPLTERFVQAIWADQIFDTHRLRTLSGESLEILSPGNWNSEGGPDFRNAKIRIGNQTWMGDVEIHLHSTGWKDHRHSLNHAYDHVILDVSLWEAVDAKEIKTSQGHVVPQLALHPYLQSSLGELLESLDPDRYPMPPTRVQPQKWLSHLTRDEILLQVESAGVYRLEQKAARIRKEMDDVDPSQTAYQVLSEALGYKHNKFAFREIARRQSWKKLTQQTSLEDRIEILLSEGARHPLRLAQVRPANHPQRRLAALAILTHPHPCVAAWFLQILTDLPHHLSPPKITHAFWSFRYSRNGTVLRKPVSLLGRDRWLEIVTNVILPFGMAQAQSSDPEFVYQILQHYERLPVSQAHRISKQAAYELNIPPPKTMRQQQGLTQIAQDFGFLLPQAVDSLPPSQPISPV